MYKKYKKEFDVEKLFTDISDLSENEKKFFKALAEKMNKSQKDFFSHIEKNTIEEYIHNIQVNDVYTLLDRETDIIYENFYPVISEEEGDDRIVFIDCKIDEVHSYEGKHKIIADGKEIEINLARTDIFVRKEKILSEIFETYGIQQPYIYFPYARRAFIIEDESINFKRNNIEFKDKNIFHANLLWNIEITPGNRLGKPEEVSVNGQKFVRFKNCSENDFISIDGYNSEEYFIKRNGSDFIDIDPECFEFSLMKFKKVTIKKIVTERAYQYSNTVHKNVISPGRIKTKADICLAVKKYYPCPDEYLNFSFKTNNDTIKDYAKEYKYFYNSIAEISMKNKNYCYLKFENKHDDIFFEDRVNYFISFMRYNYPEFYWVGVR